MTLTSETNRVQYAGDGAQIAFPITFVFWLDADIQAIHTDASSSETIWVFGTHYTLTGGDGVTGTLTVKTSPTDYTPASGETLTITSNLDDTQDTSLPEGGAFPSSSVEQQLDKIVRLIQQKAEALGRAIKLPISSTYTDLEIPDPSASKFLRWNSGANALENADVSGVGSIGVPVTVAEGGTNSTTAAAARTALGLAIGTDVQPYDAVTLKADTSDDLTVGFTQGYTANGNTGAATITPAIATNNRHKWTVTGDITIEDPTTGEGHIIIEFTNDSAGPHTVTISGDLTKLNGSRDWDTADAAVNVVEMERIGTTTYYRISQVA